MMKLALMRTVSGKVDQELPLLHFHPQKLPIYSMSDYSPHKCYSQFKWQTYFNIKCSEETVSRAFRLKCGKEIITSEEKQAEETCLDQEKQGI